MLLHQRQPLDSIHDLCLCEDLNAEMGVSLHKPIDVNVNCGYRQEGSKAIVTYAPPPGATRHNFGFVNGQARYRAKRGQQIVGHNSKDLGVIPGRVSKGKSRQSYKATFSTGGTDISHAF